MYFPRDKLSEDHLGYGFVEFINSLDADYAVKVMNKVKLYNRSLKVQKATQK